MPVDYSFQIQVYIFLLGFIVALTLLWFYFLQGYFDLLKDLDEVIYKNLGCPDFKRAKFPNELILLKHLFSEIECNDKSIKQWHDRLRYAFLLYIILFLLVCGFISLSTLM